MLNIAKEHIQRGQKQGDTEGQTVKFDEVQRQQQHAPREMDAGTEAEQQDDTQVDGHADQ